MGGFFKYKGNLQYAFVNSKKYSFVNAIRSNFSIGSFLKDKSPGNFSYCVFRFGDSENFNYTEDDVSFSPELGDKGPYRVLYGVVEGMQFNGTDPQTITYATHITLEYLFHVAEIAVRWDGLISVACFLPGTDALAALKLLEKMCFCVKEMENVNIHFVYHSEHPPKLNLTRNETGFLEFSESRKVASNETVRNASVSLPYVKYSDNKPTAKSAESCFVPASALNHSYRCRQKLAYPVNVARNVARYGSKSKYILVSDIELLPSENLVPEFLKMIQRLKDRSKSLGDHYFTKKR